MTTSQPARRTGTRSPVRRALRRSLRALRDMHNAQMYTWEDIRRMHQAAQSPARQIARVPGIPRVAVRASLADNGPQHVRRPTTSVGGDFEPRAWPYRLPAGWRWVTEFDGPAEPPDEAGGAPDDRDARGEAAGSA